LITAVECLIRGFFRI